jgi:hypothetical protein
VNNPLQQQRRHQGYSRYRAPPAGVAAELTVRLQALGFDMDDLVQLQRRINATATAQIPSCAWDCTVPVVVAHEGAVHHFGTGTLFRVADYFFLVTAGHVIKQACEQGKTLGIGGSQDGHFISLSGETLVSSEGRYGSSEDPLDIALHRFAPDAAPRLATKRFLLFNDIEFEPQSATAVYTIFGFPAVWSSPSKSADEKVAYKALQYTTYRYDRDTSALDEYQERLHLLLDGQLDQATDDDARPVEFSDRNGTPVAFPRGLGGISGCSVWRIGDLTTPLDKWATEKAKLVAVQTGVYNAHRAIKATRWIAVSTMIHGAYPEFRPAMRLWRIP